MFLDPARYPFTPHLEAAWRDIRAEYEAVRDRVIDWRGYSLYKEGWKVLLLHEFPDGKPIEENRALCPKTSALIQRCFPHHGVAGFSILRPGTVVAPHEGYPSPFLRCHLGLIVPEGDCTFRVGNETRQWAEGRVLIFDDRVMHEVWNHTPFERAIFLIDFAPEGGLGPRPG
jgi:beta-hydroxylase